MANIMGILGGLGQGVSAGVQDLERMEEAKNRKEEAQFRKELQQRERERFAEEKRLGEAVKSIKRSREGFTPEQAAANTQVGYTNLPTRDDEGRLVYGATETAIPRSEAEILKEEAALYSASPDIRNRTLGRQLQGEARVLETQDKIDVEDKEHANTLKAINANPDKWYQENLASFNADLTGGPNTKGYKAFPMSTANGTVLNIMDQQGQQIQQIPVTREALTRVAKAMYYDKLSTIDKKYAELAMKNEQIGLQRAGLDLRRLEGESDAEYRRRTAATAEAREVRETSEMGLRAPLLKAQANQANANAAYLARKPTSKADAIKEDIDARATLLFEAYPNKYKNVAAARLDAVREVTKTGLKPGTKLIENRDEGGGTIVDENNKALYNRLPNGYDVPVGVTASSYEALKKEAEGRGVILKAGTDDSGNPALRYTKDGKTFFRTIEEARASKK